LVGRSCYRNDSSNQWRVQWRVSDRNHFDVVGNRPRCKREGLALSLPILFKEDVEEMSYEELVETFLLLQRMALHLEHMVEVQASTLKVAESMLKQLGVDLD